jgi:hypothetical protein
MDPFHSSLSSCILSFPNYFILHLPFHLLLYFTLWSFIFDILIALTSMHCVYLQHCTLDVNNLQLSYLQISPNAPVYNLNPSCTVSDIFTAKNITILYHATRHHIPEDMIISLLLHLRILSQNLICYII